MSKTLLAVDDSATIRKALEITFGGEGYRVLAADDRASALARLADKPDLVLIDTVLGSEDGYALCQEVRAQMPGAAIMLLSSRFNPYDTGRGQGAGADDYSDKPFDTQQLLDKARTVLEAKAASASPVASAAAGGPYRNPAEAPAQAPAQAQAQFRGPTPTPANAVPAVQAPREGSHPPSQPAARAQTLVFGSSPVNAQTANPYATAAATAASAPQKPAGGPPPIPTRQGPPPEAPRPAAEAPRPPAVAASAPPPMPAQHAAPPRPAPAAPATQTAAVAPPPVPVAQTQAPAAPAAPAATPAVQSAVAAQLAPKLGALGLTAEQADAVIALSREVVERVVWEVVPQLAEVLIREEIQRLTKE